MIFCLRLMNFCVLTALGALLMAPVLRIDRSVDAQLRGYFPNASFAFDDARTDRLMAQLAIVKAEIHGDVCRRGDFTLLRAQDCGPASGSQD